MWFRADRKCSGTESPKQPAASTDQEAPEMTIVV
jgi:hypothetical protein